MTDLALTPQAVAAAQQVLLAALASREKAAGGTPNANYLYVPGGSLTYPGSSRDIINAWILPTQGLATKLQRRKSLDVNGIIDILTGETNSTGSNPTAACADGKQPGNLKFGKRTHVFGRIPFDTQVMQVDKIGLALNRGVFRDRTVVGDPTGPASNNGAGLVTMPMSINDAIRNEYKAQIFTTLAAVNRDFARLIYSGNPANTAGSEGYIEFFGLDLLINTGLRDAVTGQAIPAADSIVETLGGQNITTGGATAAQNAVNMIVYILRNLRDIATRTGLDPVMHTLTMRRDLFYEITRIWPCAYYTTGCNVATGATAFLDTGAMIKLRDDMRDGDYLLVDGEKVDVTIDDAIGPESVSGTTFQSSIYFVPLTMVGGRPVTYWEYQDLAVSMEGLELLTNRQNFQLLDDGRVLLHLKPPTNECVQARVLTKPRIVLEAPFLAGRLTSVGYSPLLHTRDAIPDEPYFVNGGAYTQSAPYFYIP